MTDHPKERQEMGRRARELVERECNPELHYECLMGVYETALRKHGKDIDRLDAKNEMRCYSDSPGVTGSVRCVILGNALLDLGKKLFLQSLIQYPAV